MMLGFLWLLSHSLILLSANVAATASAESQCDETSMIQRALQHSSSRSRRHPPDYFKCKEVVHKEEAKWTRRRRSPSKPDDDDGRPCKCDFFLPISTLPLDCSNEEASDIIDVHEVTWKEECHDLCAEKSDCQAVVHFWARNGSSYNTSTDKQFCYLIKAPTKFLMDDQLNITRPLPGVQASLCTLSWPINRQDVNTGCTHEQTDGQYRYGVTTTFFTCKGLPWSKCGLTGDPHILTFDRPYGDEDCPTSPKKRGSGTINVLECGFFHVIRVGRKSKGRYLLDVQGKLNNTANANAKGKPLSTMNGIAVSGELLQGGVLKWEFGKIYWKSSDGDEARDMTDELQNNSHREVYIDTLHGHVAGIATDATFSGKDITGIGPCTGDNCKPIFMFKFFRKGHHEESLFMRMIIRPNGGNNKEYGNVIISQERFRAAQWGLCGNFNGKPDDDTEFARADRTQVSPEDSLFSSDPPKCDFAKVSSAPSSEDLEDCKDVGPVLRQQCAFDISQAEASEKEGIIASYIFYTQLWKKTR